MKKYTQEEMDAEVEKAYKCGEQRKTFYKSNGTVIVPSSYERLIKNTLYLAKTNNFNYLWRKTRYK